jgi:glycosyltransferase involved in cell wall biosynthesis
MRNTDHVPIIVHSHLRWDGVWQRPQQFLSRLSKTHPVLFVEEPVPVGDETTPETQLFQSEKHPNVFIARPLLPGWLINYRVNVDYWHKKTIRDALSNWDGAQFQPAIHWFYDPMAATLLEAGEEAAAIVYDCMDELSQFRGAPKELLQREDCLLQMADVVFVGGPKLFCRKRVQNSNCYCYGCGVEFDHFSKARAPLTAIPPEMERLQGPILGFFGVVDERMDYELIHQVARAHPEWNIVIIGPHMKVDPANFPKNANIFFLGARKYDDLPAYAKSFAVCLMPFALNEATEFINPTKALEYMATGRPIVSTAIEDVVAQFSEVVEIARSPAEFIAGCERAVAGIKPARLHAAIELARSNSWDRIVEELEMHLHEAITFKLRPAAIAV